jgi:hypothetical protein
MWLAIPVVEVGVSPFLLGAVGNSSAKRPKASKAKGQDLNTINTKKHSPLGT